MALRHLHFTQSLEPLQGGGLGASALALHRKFRSCGLKSTLCATFGDVPNIRDDAVIECRRINPAALYYSPELDRRSRTLVADIDVLHGHGFYVGTNYVFGREARRQKKSLVYHAHGFFEPWILNRSRLKKKMVHWLFEDENFKYVRLWRALTSFEADQIRGVGIKTPIVIAPNGLELERYRKPTAAPRQIGTSLIPDLQKERKRLLFLSRIHPKKGLDMLLAAWAVLGQIRKSWELVIAGPDEQGYLKSVRTNAHALGIDKEVHFTGTVTGANKVALFYSADLFVLPSYSEGLPITLLEAMACETPVVASRACNCPDVYSSGAGWACDTTTGSLADVLRVALSVSDRERTERGRRGRDLVAASYSWDQIVKTIMHACESHC